MQKLEEMFLIKMTNTIARIKQRGKHFEIIVDMDKALNFRRGMGSPADFLEIDRVFYDSKKGTAASGDDLEISFGTKDVNSIAERIVKNGEVLVTQEHRDEEKEKKYKQVVDFLVVNAINPQDNRPLTAERIKTALEQAKINVKNVPVESQINKIVEELSKILPIKIQTKKVRVTVPAIHTGRTYEIINQYKETENWLSNGDLEAVVSIPSGIIMNFYDKLNSLTHGSMMTEEISEEK